VLEGLEPRALLSTVSGGSVVFEPDYELFPAASPAATVSGFTPSQIRKAYGFDQVTFGGGGSAAADGAGQTIAIVDAYNHPNIASDLAVFSAQFGLPAADLTVVNQTGGSRLPATDAGWAGEIALDVEWAHAIAPAADILLVEANSASDTDLMAAVDYARRAPGVSAVSLSWGGSEYFSWGGAESSTQLTLDQTFTTPAGHQGVTFLAAAGDSGTGNGVQWPASSPNVVAVGGTSLEVADSTGTYFAEGPWRGFRNGTSGGFSQVEAEPSYQLVAQQSGARSTPDVGYNGDPATGFAVYDSVPYQGSSGWAVVGGTSAGAPQWAALVAIANQGRALVGLAPLDGRTQTLPALYSVYSEPGTTGYSTTYAAAFHDIGADGYGYTTGLGTPKAASVVATLVAASGTPVTGGGTSAELPASPLSVTFASTPAGGIGGEKDSLKLRLTNSGGEKFSGPVTVAVYASADEAVSADDVTVTTLTLPRIALRPGGSKSLRVKFTRPDGLADGSYEYIASATATGTNTAPAQAVAPAAVIIETPNIDLATTFASDTPVAVRPGRPATALVTIHNLGNVTATGTLSLSLYASADQALDDSDVILATLPRKAHLKAGQAVTVRVRFTAPAGDAGGTYSLIASTTSSLQRPDTHSSNDTAAVATA
jgi:hypothetical protein